MRLLFVDDHRFIPLGGEVYTEDQFSAAAWNRYLSVFDELTVVGRSQGVPTTATSGQLRKSDGPHISFKLVPNLASLKGQIFVKPKARRIISKAVAEADAVIARGPGENGIVAVEEAERLGVAWGVEVSGCPWDGLWNYGSWQGKLYAPIKTARVRRVVARAPFALYVTREFLQQRYPNRLGQSVSCSDVEIKPPRQTVLDRRLERINSERPRLVLGLIGTLKTRVKGIQTVLQALAQLRDGLPSVEFRILGPGESKPWRREAADKGVEDLVRFDGVLPSGDPVLEWLDGVDLYLQPSLKEGLPRALVEAMSRGCPAIGSTCAGIPELLDADALIRPGDSGALEAAIRRAVYDQDWQARQAARNWRLSTEYATDRLDARRNAFLTKFAEYARSM